MKKLSIVILAIVALSFGNLKVYAQDEIPSGFGGDEQTIETLDKGIIEDEVLQQDSKISTSDSNSQGEFIKGVLVGVSFGAIVGIILGWLFKDRIV